MGLILGFKDMVKFIVVYLVLFWVLCFGGEVGGRVVGVVFGCSGGKESFGMGGGECGFVVVGFWVVVLVFVGEDGG